MMMMSLKFTLDLSKRGKRRKNVKAEPGTDNILISSCSYPFIVITHENQWVEAASKLLMMDCFSGQNEVSWPQFANTLHSHFLSNTRQDESNPQRSLQLYEFSYFHEKFLGTIFH